jgi:hypothetical protein
MPHCLDNELTDAGEADSLTPAPETYFSVFWYLFLIETEP